MKRSALYRFVVGTVFTALLGGCQFGEAHFEVDPNSQKAFNPTAVSYTHLTLPTKA